MHVDHDLLMHFSIMRRQELTWSRSRLKLELIRAQGSAILVPVEVITLIFKRKHGSCCPLSHHQMPLLYDDSRVAYLDKTKISVRLGIKQEP